LRVGYVIVIPTEMIHFLGQRFFSMQTQEANINQSQSIPIQEEATTNRHKTQVPSTQVEEITYTNASRIEVPSTLEAELHEEPAVATGVVAGLEDLLDQLLGLGLLAGVGHVDLAAELLGQVHVVAGGQEVLVVDDAEEDADLGAAGDGALAHAADDLLGVLLDASDEGVAVRTLLALRVGVLDDHGLLAGIAARGQDHDLTGLEELHCYGVSLVLYSERHAQRKTKKGSIYVVESDGEGKSKHAPTTL
jgi:hypothetical protein